MANSIEIMSAMETELLTRIVRNLARGNIGSAEWQARKLAARGRINESMAEVIAKGTAAARESLSRELEREARKQANIIDGQLSATKYAANLPPNADEALRETWGVWDRRASDQINKTGASLLASADSCYADIVERTTAQVLAGDITGRQAIANTSREWAAKGLPALVDKGGRQWTTEAYSQMIVRTNVRQVTTDIQSERTRQYGIDLVEIDSHAGAREGCEPYQGKVFSLTGQDKDYPALSSTTIGDADGLFGINCGHNQYPYIKGMERTYKPYPKKENDRAYENSQAQRKIERDIRRAKRDEQVAKAAGDTVGAQRASDNLLKGQSNMRTFINETGRTRRSDREQIYS